MALKLSKKAENICRFTGKLNAFNLQLVGDNQYKLGKGIIFLPDPENNFIGQSINIICWEDVAERLSEVQISTWLAVFGSYTPSMYNGCIQDSFTIDGFVIINE